MLNQIRRTGIAFTLSFLSLYTFCSHASGDIMVAARSSISPRISCRFGQRGMLTRNANGRTRSMRGDRDHDGDNALAIVVVDSCMLPRLLLDEREKASILEPEFSLKYSCLKHRDHPQFPSSPPHWDGADPTYVPLIRRRIAEAVEQVIRDSNRRLPGATTRIPYCPTPMAWPARSTGGGSSET